MPPGKKPFFAIPVFNYHAGYLSINYRWAAACACMQALGGARTWL